MCGIIDSSTFAVGQRSEICRYEVPTEVMYLMDLGPRCFKWKMMSLSGPKAFIFLKLLIPLLIRSVVNVCAISKDFLFVSIVTKRVSLEEVCLPSFDVLNCWFNQTESCLDDENKLPLKVIASFSASRCALPIIPLMVLHSLVIQSWQFRQGGISFTEVISSCHHIQYLCWDRYLVESVSSSRDVV